MIIESTANISIESLNDLIAEGHIYEITIKDAQNYQKGKTYDIFVLLSIKRIMQEFLSGCPARNPNNPNSEKEIFAYIYTKLAYWANYDELARDVNHSSEIFKFYASDYLNSSAGIDGVLIGRNGLCSGFAETLRNLLAEKGIQAKFVSGWKRGEDGKPLNEGHAWNQVKLDGEWFNCDITCDRDFIVQDLVAPKFLKSNHDFSNYMKYSSNITPKIEMATRSISDSEQTSLIGKYQSRIEYEMKPKEPQKKKKKGFIKKLSEKLKSKKTSQKGGNWYG